MRFSTITFGALLLATTAPAFAQDTPPPSSDAASPSTSSPGVDAPVEEPTPAFKFTGGATLVSDYRFRGTTQTDGDGAVQGTLGVAHESGLYAGVWASSIDGRSGDTPFVAGYGLEEVDIYGGFTKSISGFGLDVGLLYYYYPDGRSGQNTDYFEPYASVTYSIGPVATKAGINYAWSGQAGLRGYDVKKSLTAEGDNIYLYGEASLGIPTTPLSVKGHFGYSEGGYGSLNYYGRGSTDNNYIDWSATLEAVVGPAKVGVSYIDTDISNVKDPAFGRHGFARELGRGSTVVGYVGVSF